MPASVSTDPTSGCGGQESTDSADASSQTQKPAEIDPDLQAVADAWPHLPEPVKAGIVAMVKAAKPDGSMKP